MKRPRQALPYPQGLLLGRPLNAIPAMPSRIKENTLDANPALREPAHVTYPLEQFSPTYQKRGTLACPSRIGSFARSIEPSPSNAIGASFGSVAQTKCGCERL